MMRQTPTETPADDEPAKPESPVSDGVESRLRAKRSLFTLMDRADSSAASGTSDPKRAASTDAKSQSRDEDETTMYVRRSAELAQPDEVDDRTGDEYAHDEETYVDDVLESLWKEEKQEEEEDVQEIPTLALPSTMSTVATRGSDWDDLEPPRSLVAANKANNQGWIGFTCGLAAVVASALSLWPNFMASFPATVLGFGAIISGYVALTGSGRRDISQKIRAVSLAGMLLGIAGIFLGPLLFSSLGRNLRETTGPQGTRRHLQQIGEGLDRHYTEHEGYPIGGRFARNEAGVIRGEHGWMTFLLPFVGESDLYREIDLAKPYDDPINRNAMGKNVGVYFAAGGDKSRIGQGYSVSHFAGLGGEIDDAGRLSHVGIFERDVAVKRDEISDGLSNTLIVGELAGTYPPWGDPENWRTIGRGLNKDLNGFGSYSGNGSMFLLGDGSVKFFSNKTDPKVLERMSTRDGAEP